MFVLYQARKIRLEEALASADSANNLRLKIKMAGLSPDDATDGIQEQTKPDHREESSPKPQERSILFRLQDT
jgi:twitching motility protein PilU